MRTFAFVLSFTAGLLVPGLASSQSAEPVALSDAGMEELVLSSYGPTDEYHGRCRTWIWLSRKDGDHA